MSIKKLTIILLPALCLAGTAQAQEPVPFSATLSGAQVQPPGAPQGAADLQLAFTPDMQSLHVSFNYDLVSSPITGLTLQVGPEPLLSILPDLCPLPETLPGGQVNCVVDAAAVPGGDLMALASTLESGNVSARLSTLEFPTGAMGGPVLSATTVHFAGCDTMTDLSGMSVHMAGCTTATM